MDEIINDEFDKLLDDIKSDGNLRYWISYDYFSKGWYKALAWKNEQDEILEIEKDILEQQEVLR